MTECQLVVKVLREAENKGTLRAFCYADRFPTFKIVRWPGALRRRIAPGQSGRPDRIGRYRSRRLTQTEGDLHCLTC